MCVILKGHRYGQGKIFSFNDETLGSEPDKRKSCMSKGSIPAPFLGTVWPVFFSLQLQIIRHAGKS